MGFTIVPQITSNILRVTKWDVQVLKAQKIQPQSDDWIIELKQQISDVINIATTKIQDGIAELFGKDKDKGREIYETIGEFDTFLSFNGVHDSQLVQNAIEGGSFRSVNKIRKPTTCVVELGRGGTESEIELTLGLLQKYQGSTATMRVVTPYGYINNLNLAKLEYQYRVGDGANMLIARLHFQEIMYGRSAKYTTKKVSTPDKTDTNIVGAISKQVK